MSYTPIQRTLPQYVDTNGDPYSGAVLKAYTAGTSTTIAFATDSTGGTTVATVALNAAGYPETSGTQIIPHLNQNYKLSLYPTQAAADANSGDIWTIDNIILNSTDFSSNEITGVGNGTARDSAINVGQVQDSQFISLGTTAGAADAYTITASPVITAYTSTQFFIVQIHATNLTTTPYLQLNGIATPASTGLIKKLDAAKTEIAVEASDMLINGLYMFKRNSTDTNWILWNPEKPYFDGRNLNQATTAIRGVKYLPNQITISNGTDTDHDIDFTAGNFIFSDGSGQAVASAETKQLDATWAAGTGAGGLASALTIAIDTTYHCFALSNATGTSTDFGFDTSLTAANLLADAAVISAGLTKYKRIASLITDGSANILNGSWLFRADGSYLFMFDSPVLDIDTASQSTTAISYSLTTPLGIKTKVLANALINDTNSVTKIYISDPDSTDLAPATNTSPLTTLYAADGGGAGDAAGQVTVWTNTSSEIRARADLALDEFRLATLGFEDFNL